MFKRVTQLSRTRRAGLSIVRKLITSWSVSGSSGLEAKALLEYAIPTSVAKPFKWLLPRPSRTQHKQRRNGEKVSIVVYIRNKSTGVGVEYSQVADL